MNNQGKSWLGIIIVILIIAGAFWFFSYNKDTAMIPVNDINQEDLGKLKLFSEGLSSVDIDAEHIGLHSFSPGGKYFLFTAFKPDADISNMSYLMDTKTGQITKLPGVPERNMTDERIIQLYGPDGHMIYFTETGETKSFDLGENVFYGALSPNSKVLAVNTDKGIRLVDISSGTISELSTDYYDGFYSWYKDGKRGLGFRSTGEFIFEAQEAREFGLWDIGTKAFTKINADIKEKTIRMTEWIIPDKVARVNAGWDDGSFDYIVDVQNGKTVTIGDTSGSLMGGIKTDSKRNLFAVVGGDDQSNIGTKALIYRGMNKLYEVTNLKKGYFRENMFIVSESELLYIRKQMRTSGPGVTELVLLDFITGEEKVLRPLAQEVFISLSLAPDNNTYVVSSKDKFFVGKIR